MENIASANSRLLVSNGINPSARNAGAISKNRLGRFVRNDGALTAKQRSWVVAYVANGGNGTLAAEMAGYDYPREAACKAMQNPQVMAAVRRERSMVLESGACLALGVMQKLMADDDINPETRFKAARWTLEAAGHGAVHSAKLPAEVEDKPLSEMSIAELDAFINQGHDTLSKLEAKRDAQLAAAPLVGASSAGSEPVGPVVAEQGDVTP